MRSKTSILTTRSLQSVAIGLRTRVLTALAVTCAVAWVPIVPVAADDAPVVPTQSGTVVPVHEEFIRLENETIDIYLGRDEYRVNVEYAFHNTGPETVITMGFPNESDWMYGTSIKNFRAWVDGAEQEIYRRKSRESNKPYGPGTAPDYYYECFDTAFNAKETRTVRNSYSQEYVTDYDQSVHRATYVLSTGAYWRGKIDEIVVRIHYGRNREDLRARSGFFFPEDVSGAGTRYEGISITPKPTATTTDGVQIVLTDIEPDFDIQISMPPPIVARATASSELAGTRYSYAPSNVLDVDAETSWVEGVSGAGIGERLVLRLSAVAAGGKLEGSYEIAAVGIINGYAAREDLYYSNNRVKTLEMAYDNAVGREEAADSVVWDLDETMEMQYYRFVDPVLMSDITLTIQSVYPGNKYDDTCIAEVVVVPAPPRQDADIK